MEDSGLQKGLRSPPRDVVTVKGKRAKIRSSVRVRMG